MPLTFLRFQGHHHSHDENHSASTARTAHVNSRGPRNGVGYVHVPRARHREVVAHGGVHVRSLDGPHAGLLPSFSFAPNTLLLPASTPSKCSQEKKLEKCKT